MSATDFEFRWTLGLSLIVHAIALGAIGFTGLMREPLPLPRELQRDTWVGTTVTVVVTPRGNSVPTQPAAESQGPVGKAKQSDPGRAGDPRKMRVRTPATTNGEEQVRNPSRRADQPSAPRPSHAIPSAAGAGVDLRQAMRESLTGTMSESGAFGAAGVDLTERRLPKAITRALPVAIGAEPGWWKLGLGSLGSIRFTVALSETGKLEEVTFDEENKHPFHARVVRRVAKLLALGTFALPTSTAGSAEQAFELRLVMERREPDANSTADPGDLVEKGFEAPSADKPGQAIIRDAPGHTMRAFLKPLKSKLERSPGGASEE